MNEFIGDDFQTLQRKSLDFCSWETSN